MNLEVPVSELQKKKLFIATPMYGGQCFGSYTKALIDLSRVCQSYGIQAQFSFIFNESLITRARNYLVDEFMRSGFTHMMFIDSDIDFNPMDVIALLALDKLFIGDPYPKKCVAWENVYDAVRFGLVPNNDRGKLADFATSCSMPHRGPKRFGCRSRSRCWRSGQDSCRSSEASMRTLRRPIPRTGMCRIIIGRWV